MTGSPSYRSRSSPASWRPEFTLGDFERLTTLIKLRGGGQEGVGGRHLRPGRPRRPARRRAAAGLSGSRTFAEFSELIGETDLFPSSAPERDVSRAYRRWAFESAALDLALRQANTNLAAALRREPRPVDFVSSMRLAPFGSEERSSIDPLLARLAVYPTLRFKLDPTNDWDDGLIAALAQTGAVDSLDLKGFYKGTPVNVGTDAALYAKLIEAFPDAWLEDPDVNAETKPLLDPVAERVTWDAPIHSVADIEAMPWAPKMVNIKPSRFGAVGELFNAYDYREEQGIGAYGGGQTELGQGRGQIQYLASIFHPTRPTTSPLPATTTPTGPEDRARRPARWSRGRRQPAFAGRDRVAERMSFAKTLNEQVASEFAAHSSTSRSPSTTTPRRAPARRLLLPPGGGGAKPRDDDHPVPARLRPPDRGPGIEAPEAASPTRSPRCGSRLTRRSG